MKWLKVGAVIFGAVLITALGIDAADTLSGSKSTLLGQLISSEQLGVCEEGMVAVDTKESLLCMDAFEAVPSLACPHPQPSSEVETQENLNSESCSASSQEGLIPWRFVSVTQAQQLCARAGKRLPTNAEWYAVAQSMANSSTCAIETGGALPSPTGSSACITPSGVYDVIGNVWEWIDGSVTDGMYNNRLLPKTGYVGLVDLEGVVIKTQETASEEFGNDYALTSQEGIKGIIRGGFYGSKSDAGIFAQNLSVPLDFKSAGVGFRCVSSR